MSIRFTRIGVAVLLAATLSLPMLAQAQSETGAISLREAEAVVSEAYPNAVISSIQRLQREGVTLWEVRLENGTLLTIDARDGSLIGHVEPQAGLPALSLAPAVPPLALSPAVGSIGTVTLGTGTFEQALTLSNERYPGVVLSEAHLRPVRGTGSLQWEITLTNRARLHIDPATGQVLYESGARGRGRGARPAIAFPSISFDQALSIAQAQFPNALLRDAHLHQRGAQDGYIVVWRIGLHNAPSVFIDAQTGNIVSIGR